LERRRRPYTIIACTWINPTVAKTPATRSSSGDVSSFLQRARNLQRFSAGRARLVFAMDATASRQPTWDLACELQAGMFRASAEVASLSIQLAWYRGIGELQLSPWQSDTAALARQMSEVRCAAGRTQIARLLRRVLEQQRRTRAEALVFIGDALEEDDGPLLELAGQCRLQRLPLFMFQEGYDPAVRACFSGMARLSGGPCCQFDAGSAQRLAELLGAVARYAAGGRAALEQSTSGGARLLLEQLPR
jgi:hypothetical protein